MSYPPEIINESDRLYFGTLELLSRAQCLRFEAEGDHFGRRMSSVPVLWDRKIQLESSERDLRLRCEEFLGALQDSLRNRIADGASDSQIEETRAFIRHVEGMVVTIDAASNVLYGLR